MSDRYDDAYLFLFLLEMIRDATKLHDKDFSSTVGPPPIFYNQDIPIRLTG